VSQLRLAATGFAVAVAVHTADHVRRGLSSVDTDVQWAGNLALVLEVGVVVLVFVDHRWAPLAAATVGGSLAVGYLLVHVLPHRGWLSDPLFSGGAESASQAAALLEIAAATWLAIAGLVELRRRGGLTSVVAR
jgi:hypothetical protein